MCEYGTMFIEFNEHECRIDKNILWLLEYFDIYIRYRFALVVCVHLAKHCNMSHRQRYIKRPSFNKEASSSQVAKFL